MTGFKKLTSAIPDNCPMTRIAVIDFETTGLSPAMGDRATEIAIVILEGGEVVKKYLVTDRLSQ